MGARSLAAVVLLSFVSTTAPSSVAAAPDRFDAVVIDAGHGGEDHGARGAHGLVEKQLVLDVSKRLAKRLRARGLRVTMTRQADVFVPLEQRTSIANDARADLFISIHANSASSAGARGSETYFVSLQASDESAREVALRENEAFAASASRVESDPLVALLGDMIATEHVNESSEFARLAEAELSELRWVPSRGVKQAPFVVLMGVQMPASLIEIGFLSNADEEKALHDEPQRDALAEALARAVVAFAERYDGRRGVEPTAATTLGRAGR